MTKITLLSALTALLILPSFASAATTADFAPGPNETWPSVLTVTTDAAGNAESKGEQTVVINVTSGTFGANVISHGEDEQKPNFLSIQPRYRIYSSVKQPLPWVLSRMKVF